MSKKDRIFRARQIIIEHPNWGRRRINALLRTEFGFGLRDSTIDLLTKPPREERQAGIKPVFDVPKPRMSKLQRTMKHNGFLNFEIFGVRGSPAVGLGKIPPDSWHPAFRQIIENMIRSRSREYHWYLNRADRAGWSRSKTAARWKKRIQNHYKKGEFPEVGQPVKRGGGFVTVNNQPSPWALYKAWETKLIKQAPFGGEGWGTPRPTRRKREFVPRPVSKGKLRTDINRRKRWLGQLEENIVKQRSIGNETMVKQYEQQRQNIKSMITKLEGQLN